jgi:hypothetical protein
MLVSRALLASEGPDDLFDEYFELSSNFSQV